MMSFPVWLPGPMFLSGGLCPGGFCPRGLHPGGLCLGDLCREIPESEKSAVRILLECSPGLLMFLILILVKFSVLEYIRFSCHACFLFFLGFPSVSVLLF